MLWADFYDNHMDWSESTLRSRISSLKDIGSGEEIVDVVLYLPNEKLKSQLIRKAIRLEAEFTHEDFMNLDGELTDEVYQELANYAGYDASDPYLDEDNLQWDDFASEYYNWSEEVTLRRIGKLKSLGSPEEVYEVICDMPSLECEEALHEKAIASGVKFDEEDLYERHTDGEAKEVLDAEEDFAAFEANINLLCENLDRILQPQQPEPKKRNGPGFFGVLGAVLGILSGLGSDKHDSGHCDGDCANCPPHYGYRYGRWYYGHGHQYSCQRGGNGGASGRTYRD